MGPISQALFLDVPYLIDSAWRHTEYWVGAECEYRPGTPPDEPEIEPRPFWHKLPFWFFAITVFFASYGPTWGGLCAIAPHDATDLLRKVLGVAIAVGSVAYAFVLFWKARRAIETRFT